MFLVMSLMAAKIGRNGAERGAITPRCGAELKLGSGDKASRGEGDEADVGWHSRFRAHTFSKGGDGRMGPS